MPATLRNTLSENIFDLETQKDAICNFCGSLMDHLINKCRRNQKECKRPYDSKWSANRHEYVAKLYCTTVRHIKDADEVDLCYESTYPSFRSTETTTKTEEN